MIFLMTIVILF